MKAYENMDFLHSSHGRIVRVLSEFLEPQRRLRKYKVKDTIVFFGSARTVSSEEASRRLNDVRRRPANSKQTEELKQKDLEKARRMVELSKYYDDAVELAKQLTIWSDSLPKKARHFMICSGGGPGMMEAANRGATKEAKGLSAGFTISMSSGEESANPYISPDLNFEFHYFFMRKYWFAYLAKALVILPGGFGTLDELMEILTLLQTGKMLKKIPIVVYGKKYWDDIIRFDHLVEWGTIDRKHFELIHFCNSPKEAFDYLTSELTRLYL